MKKLTITTIWLLVGLALFSQTEYEIDYTYDDAGNRTNRNVIVLVKDNPEKLPSEKSSEDVFTDILGDQEITIYPNPTKGELTVAITNLKATASARVEVYTLTGEQVFVKNKIRNKTKVDLSKQKPGTYILKILLDNQVSTWKIIKE